MAARPQDLTKEFNCEVLIADEVRRFAKVPDNAAPRHTVAILGRDEKLQVRAVAEARRLAVDDGFDESTLKLPMSLSF